MIFFIVLLYLQCGMHFGLGDQSLCGESGGTCICHYYNDVIIDCSRRGLRKLPGFINIIKERTTTLMLQDNYIDKLTINQSAWPILRSVVFTNNPVGCKYVYQLTKQNIAVEYSNCTGTINFNLASVTSIRHSNDNQITHSNDSSVNHTNDVSIRPNNKESISPTKDSNISPGNKASISPNNNASISPTIDANISPTKKTSISPTKDARIRSKNVQNMGSTNEAIIIPYNNASLRPTSDPNLEQTKEANIRPTNDTSNDSVMHNLTDLGISRRPTPRVISNMNLQRPTISGLKTSSGGQSFPKENILVPTLTLLVFSLKN